MNKIYHEMDILSFLDEAMEMRIKAITEQAHQRPDFTEANQATISFIESIADENIKAAVLQYEALKNDYIALLMPYLYRTGAKDSLMLHGLLLKQIFRQN